MVPESERWAQLQQVFENALLLPPDERPAFLDRACGTAVALRAEVEAMLAADQPDRALGIERMVNDDTPLAASSSPDVDPFIGMRLGPWRVGDVLGRGGMGTVYLAERADGQYVQRVALKLVHAGVPHAPGPPRFQAERHILARLSHPNIARLLDAGFTPEGSAYLVMEYVDGSRVTTYCDEHRLTIDERLRLLRVICDATQHAHQSLIVHRDLKPSNVFVSHTGEVKLLDFGIAKLLDDESSGADPTARDQRALTPAYAAPEQLRGEPVTTATDVYALGVIAYELLTGQRPKDVTNPGSDSGQRRDAQADVSSEPTAPSVAVRRAAARAAADRIASDRAARAVEAAHASAARSASAGPGRAAVHQAAASGDAEGIAGGADAADGAHRAHDAASAARVELATVRSTSGARHQPEEIAARRKTTPTRLARHLSGDLDRVVLKALRPEPERRYASAGQFAEDIDRLLDGRPVMAQPDTLGYRVTRFVTRNRGGVAIGVGLLVLVAAFGAISAMQARALAIERDRARLEASRAQRGFALLSDLFTLADPAEGRGDTITARALLDRGVERIASELSGDPESQAALYLVVGRVYGSLALHDTAIGVLERALTLQRARGGDTLQAAETLHALAYEHVLKNDYAAAIQRYREAMQIRRTQHAPPLQLAASLEGLGRALSFTGKHSEAEAPLREALELHRREPGKPGAPLMSLLQELGLALHRKGDFAGAEPFVREAAAIGSTLPDSSPGKIDALVNMARQVQGYQRDPAAAEPFFREALALARRLHSTDHQEIAVCLSELARDLRDQGRVSEAEPLARESLSMFRRMYGTRHREVMIGAQSLAGMLRSLGKIEEAEPLNREAFSTATSLFGDGHPLTLAASRTLAALLESKREFAEALRLRETELANAIRAFGDHDVYVALALTGLGFHHLTAGHHADAERYYRRALDVREHIHPADSPRVADARLTLANALAKARRFGDAEPLMLEAYARLRDKLGVMASETKGARAALAALYEAWGRPEDARAYR